MIQHMTTLLRNLLPVRAQRHLIQSRQMNAANTTKQNPSRQLLVDVSVISRFDARTGIQRSVRALFSYLIDNPPTGYTVLPVAATRNQSYCYIDYSPRKQNPGDVHVYEKVTVGRHDIFLGLDLAANIAPHHHTEFEHWKIQGTSIYFIVYDLLPVLQPHWFNPKTCSNIQRWLRTISIYGDGFICISETVRRDLLAWQETHYGLTHDIIPSTVIPLGCDIEASCPTLGISADEKLVLDKMDQLPTVLMVGTIEPRKGHIQAIEAMEILWKTMPEAILVIAGRPGWKTYELQHCLKHHPELGSRLFWLYNATDEVIQHLYRKCRLAVVASEGEGFGLPLLEASRYGKPVLARDIAAFREISGNNVTFFSGKSAGRLSAAMLTLLAQQTVCSNDTYTSNFMDWQSSGASLNKFLRDTSLEQEVHY